MIGDVFPVAPVGAPDPEFLSVEVLRPILSIRGLSAEDRLRVERLVCEADRAAAQLVAGCPAVHVDLWVERARRMLAEADGIVARYSGFVM